MPGARHTGGTRRLVVGFAMDWAPPQRERIASLRPDGIELLFLGSRPGDAASLARLDALVVGTEPVATATLDAAPHLRLVQRWGTGFDNVDPDAIRARGLLTAELPGVNARSVSEFILLAMLSLLRHLPDVTVAWSRGEWLTGRSAVPPRRLQGKTIGLLGFGAIGRDLAGLLRPFEVEILFHDRDPVAPAGLPARFATKDALLRSSDVVSVQLPSTPATRGAIGEAEIACMKRSAVLVSVSRSGVVDEMAVRAAVRDGRLAAAGFDNHAVEPLPEGRVFHQPGILATPHLGGASIEGFEALIHACFASILRLCREGPAAQP
ncbi:MAG: NAD(P)-dependent oxidoreductase [Microvirga sp.]